MSTAATAGTSATWPADIIHVNEDGWVLINRGSQHGVQPGLRLLVVGQGIRELRNLFVPGSENTDADDLPMVLRIRRTYEQLEVIHAEADCAIAVATRTPASRRPSVYTGPEGELLVWVPLPEGWTWPHPGEDDADDTTEDDDATADTGWQGDAQDSSDATDDSGEETDDSEESVTDVPPERGEQDDERWEEALPLNGVSVGDIVVPALPASGASATTAANSTTASSTGTGSSFEQGRDYDWMKSNE